MSLFGEAIIDRLHEKCQLRNPNNPVAKIIDNGVGEWLDKYDEKFSYNQVFLQDATGAYLDLWGRDFNVPRRLEEDDDSYRQRIILESLGHLTVPYLLNVFGLVLYCYVEDYDPTENVLTSDNPYLCTRHMTVASDDVQSILGRKFVLGSDLVFLDLEE